MVHKSDRKPVPKPCPYSDASSTYWPPGWNWERHVAMDDGFLKLPEDEQDKLRNGFREALGEDGVDQMASYLFSIEQGREEQALIDSGAPPPDFREPDFIKTWRKRHEGQPFGFVAFKTTLYDDDEKWETFKKNVDDILNVPFDNIVQRHRQHEHEAVASARSCFNLLWVEDETLAGATADVLRQRYAEMLAKDKVPRGMQQTAFLCASPESVASVQELADADFPSTDSRYWRAGAPFLLAVMQAESVNPHGEEDPADHDDPHDPRNWYKPVFKVPIEVIPAELWCLLESDFMELQNITRSVYGSNELGGTMPVNKSVDELLEMWWGTGPTPASLKRRRRLRG